MPELRPKARNPLRISVRLDPEVAAKLDGYAFVHNITKNSLINVAIDEYIALSTSHTKEE